MIKLRVRSADLRDLLLGQSDASKGRTFFTPHLCPVFSLEAATGANASSFQMGTLDIDGILERLCACAAAGPLRALSLLVYTSIKHL